MQNIFKKSNFTNNSKQWKMNELKKNIDNKIFEIYLIMHLILINSKL